MWATVSRPHREFHLHWYAKATWLCQQVLQEKPTSHLVPRSKPPAIRFRQRIPQNLLQKPWPWNVRPHSQKTSQRNCWKVRFRKSVAPLLERPISRRSHKTRPLDEKTSDFLQCSTNRCSLPATQWRIPWRNGDVKVRGWRSFSAKNLLPNN